ncbi:MAG TPA: M28 family peptidase [Anaeromyxobacteraceae bacterium]|nr:M28 family peptidase [Anaeromyxobacteraceae bacterium]
MSDPIRKPGEGEAMSLLRAFALAAFIAGGAVPGAARAGPPATFSPSAAERRAAEAITPALLRAHVKFLASDLLEGRGPGTRGDALAEAYVASQMEALGLEPAAPGGGWFQKVPMIGVETRAVEPPRFEAGSRSYSPEGSGYVANMGTPREALRLDGVDVVFVGYGIVAPEYRWDDYAGADVKGKVVLVMNDDPSDDPALFAGKTRLYYGRWTYKYEEAARHGAAGAIVIHTDESASYPWSVVQSSWAGPQYQLPDDGEPALAARFWTTDGASRRLVALGGKDLDALRAAARRRGFAAVPLGVKLSVSLAANVTRIESANVLGRLPGSDPRRAGEAVLVTAHHDHLGVKPGKPGEDAIYNGAVDNATGVAGLLGIARAAAALPARPARSIVFAAVAGEEQGLLGSRWLARHPPVPTGRIAADLNMDAMNVLGRTRDVTVIGLGKSTLDEAVRAIARWQGRVVTGDPFPERGSFYRSDQFELAKVGVPATAAGSSTDYVGRPPGWGRAKNEEWKATHYHQPSDEWRDEYDLSGMVEDVQLLFHEAVLVAGARDMPRWRKGDEFEPARERALRAAFGEQAGAGALR